jgi:SAM-dependent methyltransferase
MSVLSELNLIFWSFVNPWLFMGTSLSYLPGTLARLIMAGDFGTLTSWPRLQSKWFGAFWAWAGPNVRSGGEVRVIPLLEGRASGGHVMETPVGTPVSGVVLEVGAGSGMWVSLFGNRKLPSSSTAAPSDGQSNNLRQRAGKNQLASKITRVYGVEPNSSVHDELRRNVAAADLEGVYQVVPVGIEALSEPGKWQGTIEKESLDCIVSVLCLCSIPEPEKNIAELYKYLKKGGRWYVYEHVKVEGLVGMGLYQRECSRNSALEN